ncbi:hypothetical protein Y032_0121g967 [Ancylostoma ceylanicum]|uniref:Uncharacterized protein n=1 Tax=Ancylostoma ceylanicum TaxID=53326 RepID=A0A016TAJ0_9BILA|nr:hypothetical protein Y032_0121g967 [Ancylostoma ceylanicum]
MGCGLRRRLEVRARAGRDKHALGVSRWLLVNGGDVTRVPEALCLADADVVPDPAPSSRRRPPVRAAPLLITPLRGLSCFLTSSRPRPIFGVASFTTTTTY